MKTTCLFLSLLLASTTLIWAEDPPKTPHNPNIPVIVTMPSRPDVPVTDPFLFNGQDVATGDPLPAMITLYSYSLTIDFGASMIGVENITLQNLVTGETSLNNYYFYTSLVNVPYSGNGGPWSVMIVTLDGRRYCGSFYSSAPVSPGAGDAPENCF